jgi:hypothetical protein
MIREVLKHSFAWSRLGEDVAEGSVAVSRVGVDLGEAAPSGDGDRGMSDR